MIQCDYCGKRVNPRDPFIVVQTGRAYVHLHNENNPDCADQWLDQAKTIKGERPAPTPAV